MPWLIFAFASALMSAVSDTLCKKASQHTDSWTVTWVRFGYSSLFLLPLLAFVEIPNLDQVFWLATAALLPLELTAASLSMRALQISPLSLTIPYLAFTPLFLLLVPTLILGERLSIHGMLGVICIVAGAYLLNLQTNNHLNSNGPRWLAPLRAIARENGSRLMLMAAMLYSLTSTLGKVAVKHSSPLFFASFYYPLAGLCLFPIAAMKSGRRLRFAATQVRLFLLIGVAVALTVICHFLALNQAEVAYMISIKRTSMIFATVLGWLFFQEKNLRQRLLGCGVMLAGVILISST